MARGPVAFRGFQPARHNISCGLKPTPRKITGSPRKDVLSRRACDFIVGWAKLGFASTGPPSDFAWFSVVGQRPWPTTTRKIHNLGAKGDSSRRSCRYVLLRGGPFQQLAHFCVGRLAEIFVPESD